MAHDNEVDVSRRDLGTLLGILGGSAGLAVLAGCTQMAGASPEITSSIGQAVSGSATMKYADSITELRAIIGGSVGWVGVLGGYAARGDGGGGLFFWDSNAAVDDGGTILNFGGINSNTAGWRRIYSGSLNVKWFGATGNGSTADDAAIQNAIKVATGFDASKSGSVATKSGSIFIPIGAYKITNTLLFVGDGIHTLGMYGELGSNFMTWTPPASASLFWLGAANGTMLELRGINEASIENVDFDGHFVAGICVWLHSNQPNKGAGSNGTAFRRCSFVNVAGGASSVAFQIGDTTGFQVDDVSWEHCKFLANQGNQSQISAAACWRTLGMGNTKNFSFYECSFLGAQYGIDWAANSGCLTVESCRFATFGVPSWATGQDAACLRLGNAGNTVVRACEVECNPDLAGISGGARFITSQSGGISASTVSLTVEGCQVFVTMPSDNILILYTGKMMLNGNAFNAGFGSPSNNQNPPKISCGGVSLLSTNPAPVAIFSINNFYPFLPAGSYAPFVQSGNALTGPGTWGGARRNSVWSIGDTTVNRADTACMPLTPWIGTLPQLGPSIVQAPTWSPGTVPSGVAATWTQVNWGGSTNDALAVGDMILVSCDQALPAGVILTAAVTGPNRVTATLLNMSGSTFTPSGNLIFSALPRTLI